MQSQPYHRPLHASSALIGDTTFFHFVKEQYRLKPQGVRTTAFSNATVLTPHQWWRMTGSNRRPPACKAGALPAELIPRDWRRMVGLVGLEPTTPALSRRCSNQ